MDHLLSRDRLSLDRPRSPFEAHYAERPEAAASKLFCADHRGLLPSLDPNVVDLICTSPNFNVGWPYGGDPSSDQLPIPEYQQSLADLFAGCMHVLRPAGVMAVVVPPAIEVPGDRRLFFTADRVRGHLESRGWLLHGSIVWCKSLRDDAALPLARGGIKGNAGDFRLRFSHEVIVIASKGGYGREVRESWSDEPELRDWLKDVWFIRPARRAHPLDPQPFPDELVRRLVWLFTDGGDLVLDPCAGTGVTARVALELRRRAWLIEREPSYWNELHRIIRPGEYSHGDEVA